MLICGGGRSCCVGLSRSGARALSLRNLLAGGVTGQYLSSISLASAFFEISRRPLTTLSQDASLSLDSHSFIAREGRNSIEWLSKFVSTSGGIFSCIANRWMSTHERDFSSLTSNLNSGRLARRSGDSGRETSTGQTVGHFFSVLYARARSIDGRPRLVSCTEVYTRSDISVRSAPLRNPLASKERHFVFLSLPKCGASKFEPLPKFQLLVI